MSSGTVAADTTAADTVAADVAAITGLGMAQAASFVEMAGGDAEAAVALFFDMQSHGPLALTGAHDDLQGTGVVGEDGVGEDEDAGEDEDDDDDEDDDNDDDDDDDDDEGEEEDDDDSEEYVAAPPSKRLRVVEPTDPEKLAAAGKSNFVQFDDTLMRKTHLDLLNLTPSKLVHKSITLWRDDVTDQEAALELLSSQSGGWWVHHFPGGMHRHPLSRSLPVRRSCRSPLRSTRHLSCSSKVADRPFATGSSWGTRSPNLPSTKARSCPPLVSSRSVPEIDHVWRVIVNAHLHSKSCGPLVRLTATSFAETNATREVEVCICTCR